MASRSFQAHQQAIRKVKQALARDTLQQKILEKLTGLSPQIISRFLTGKPIDREALESIYSALGLALEENDGLIENGEPDLDRELSVLIEQVRQHCCRKIKRRHSQVTLLNQQQVEVSQLCVDLCTVERLSRETCISPANLLQDFKPQQDFERFGLGEPQQRLSGLQAIARSPKSIVIGKPGSGKSTFLKHLAIACCNGQLHSDYIPILLELKELTPLVTRRNALLKEYIHLELGLIDPLQTENILNSGKVLLLFDGLDEMPETARRNVQYQIRNFSQQYYKNSIVLTCRTQATEYTFPNFEYVEVVNLSSAQVEQFAKNWFCALTEKPHHGNILAKQFIGKLRFRENQQIAKLAVTPILLSFACWVFQTFKYLPSCHFDFYEQSIKLLLDPKDIDSSLDPQLFHELLNYIATKSFEREELFFEEKTLQKDITDYLNRRYPSDLNAQDKPEYKAILEILEEQYGLLLERAPGIYSFAHLTLHEYFLTKAILDRFSPQFSDRSFSSLMQKSWQDIFFLAAERMNNPDDLLLQIKQKTDTIIATNQKLQIFMAWVTQKASLVQVSYKQAAVRAFYFSLAVDRILEPKLARSLDFSHAVDRALKSSLHDRSLACHLDENLNRVFKYNSIRKLDYEFLLDLILDCLLVTFAYDLGLFLTFVDNLHIQLEHELKQSLKRFKSQLPDAEGDKSTYQKWWKSNSEIWTQNLRLTIIAYRNIGYDWQFKTQEKELLKQYYDANKLLVECLKRISRVSGDVRQEIESTLLLPIAEIEKRRKNNYQKVS
ncbi:NACHT domain-containing NTPase [Lusitaniella coriacea LEGE 07157]|uniref:NACHT domain-containing NTPase n=1 Tax=Lusitaniella coriacea LEGE 07157 TaxID=945747 RepID=A0A8J7B7S5_9CYAN|nr:NACHT domain-containing protein [Lusitaniella coriacea]MBE9115501.1 NACHT domain-containing NTPase [Lusitaniella coriacea LEGE 07157]